MLSSELILRIQKIQLRAGYLANEALAGEYVSAFRGQGMEFDEVREYVPGDDVRLIDWNVTARMSQPFVKIYREEREMTIMLMVDVSQSLNFGTVNKTKYDQAIELAAVLAFLATKNNDKVGLLVFSDHIEQYIPPKKGRAHIWNIIRAILTHEAKGKKTNLAVALDYMLRVNKKKTTCFLISDFLQKGFEKTLTLAGKKHELICVTINDLREKELPDVGVIELEDTESGERIFVDTSDKYFKKSYFDHLTQMQLNFEKFRKTYGIDGFTVETSGDTVTPLEIFMRKRVRRRK